MNLTLYNYYLQSSDETYNYPDYPNYDYDAVQMSYPCYDNSLKYSNVTDVENISTNDPLNF